MNKTEKKTRCIRRIFVIIMYVTGMLIIPSWFEYSKEQLMLYYTVFLVIYTLAFGIVINWRLK